MNTTRVRFNRQVALAAAALQVAEKNLTKALAAFGKRPQRYLQACDLWQGYATARMFSAVLRKAARTAPDGAMRRLCQNISAYRNVQEQNAKHLESVVLAFTAAQKALREALDLADIDADAVRDDDALTVGAAAGCVGQFLILFESVCAGVTASETLERLANGPSAPMAA